MFGLLYSSLLGAHCQNMALSAKSEVLKQVPWFSLAEWHQVYKQIYSNDTSEQTRAYEKLLVWKARIPKLPVGVECTLSIIQVCLRDREWTPKIDNAELPMYYENDLCLMYSTTIMRFLNHISNIGHTKQTSLFQIAKQLKIPEWIVNLRHDAAHGHELPSIGALRMAANVLLAWLHEEYWAAEAKAMEERYEKSSENPEDEKSCESHALVVFFELWTAVGLYIKADYKSVRDLPDAELRNTLVNLCTVLPDSPVSTETTSLGGGNVRNENDYLLTDAQSILFSEMSTLASKNKSIPNIEDILMRILFDCEAFLPGPEIIRIFMTKDESIVNLKINYLPPGMIVFWQNFIVLLHDNKLLDELLWRLFDLVNLPHEETNKRLIASLWIKSICNALLKLRITQSVTQAMEHSLDDSKKRMGNKHMVIKVREIVNKTNPELSESIWFNASSDIPAFLRDINFATDLLLNANVFTKKFIHPILDLVTPPIGPKCKDHLLKLLRIHTKVDAFKEINSTSDENPTYSVDDLIKIYGNGERDESNENGISQRLRVPDIADQTVRNKSWEIASADYDWAACPFGVLPWQIESLEMIEPAVTLQLQPTLISKESTIIPGLIDEKILTMESRVNWDNVLRKKKRLKRKRQRGEADVMVDRAIEIVKKRQK